MAGSLTGSNATQAFTGVTNNLSSPVRDDWIQFPQNVTSPNRKLGGGSTFGTPTTIGPGTLQFSGAGAEGPAQTWTDGTPAASGSQQAFVYVDPTTFTVGQGWQMTVAADTNKRVLEIYWYGYSCASKIVASLSDGSAADLTLTATQVGLGNEQFYKATITYWANGPATLTLKCTATAFASSYGQTGLLAGAYITTFSVTTGTLASTLGSIVSSIAAKETFSGTLTATLGAATAAIATTQTFSGALVSTLGAATFAGTGGSGTTGTINPTLGNAVLAASGRVDTRVAMSAVLANATASFAGRETFSGTLARTLGNTIVSFNTTAVNPNGVMSAVLGNATGSIAAQEVFSGSTARTLANATTSFAAAEIFSGAFAQTLASATVSASGGSHKRRRTIHTTGTA